MVHLILQIIKGDNSVASLSFEDMWVSSSFDYKNSLLFKRVVRFHMSCIVARYNQGVANSDIGPMVLKIQFKLHAMRYYTNRVTCVGLKGV